MINNIMKNTIEVEIRGRLDDAQYDRVKAFLDKNGSHRESQNREMYLLRDYPGYSKDFVGRQTDIRLRNTNGFSEIMLKQKVGSAREEVSLALQDKTLDTAKKVLRALGCKKAIWMHRLKEVYQYNGIEWSLVIAPQNIRYWEAELVVADESGVSKAHERLAKEAMALGLNVLDDNGTRDVIHELDTRANKEVEL